MPTEKKKKKNKQNIYRGYRDSGKENGNYYLGFRVYMGSYVGVICGLYGELYKDSVGIMEKKMETTIRVYYT